MHQAVAVPLIKSYLLLNHGPVTLVASSHGGIRNVMAASWAMPLDFDPPKVAVVIDAGTHSRKLIEASGEFVLAIPARHQAAMVEAVGNSSGRDHDKFAHHGLVTHPASLVGAPLIEGCVAWLECKVMPRPDNEARHDLFLAEVVAAWADPAVFSAGRWHFPDAARSSIHYVAGGQFFATGEPFQVGRE